MMMRARSLSSSSSSTTRLVRRGLAAAVSPRDELRYDVVVVGGGVAGLSAAVRLRRLCARHDDVDVDLSVCVVDKGDEIGAHVLSGAVLDPRGMDELFEDDDEDGRPFDWRGALSAFSPDARATPVTEDVFSVLTDDEGAVDVPRALVPPALRRDEDGDQTIVSLGRVCRWLGTVAEDLGVEVYPGFAVDEILYDDGGNGGVIGVATKDAGVGRDGVPKAHHERGVALLARQTLFAEGARGSCTERLVRRFDLRSDCVRPPTYGLGLKELWEVPPERSRPGFVRHTVGWPLQSSLLDRTHGGGFLYHQEPNLVSVGLVVGTDYANPHLNPYEEFQRYKTHPTIRRHIEGGECLSYGARLLNEGGLHAAPKLVVPGAMLLGCAAGLLDPGRTQGAHVAAKSGVVAADAVFRDAAERSRRDENNENDDAPRALDSYETDLLTNSWVGRELRASRNVRAAFSEWGLGPGLLYAGTVGRFLKGREPWTIGANDGVVDSERTLPSSDAAATPIDYSARRRSDDDDALTFDLSTNLRRSGVHHGHDQPSHLRIRKDRARVPETVSLPKYDGPEQRFCPAGVYEYVDEKVDDDCTTKKKLVVNAQNCLHCKCCDVKMPRDYVEWTVPEGGGGPNYQNM